MVISPRLIEQILFLCPDGVIGNDRKGNIFLFNPGAERIFGYAWEEVIGKMNVSLLYPPGRARDVRRYLFSEEFGGKGRLQDFETEIVARDGRWIPIRLSCTVVHDDDNKEGIIGFFTDISTGKTLQDRLRESEKKYRSIIENASDVIISIDEQWKILMVNPAAVEVLGYGKEEMIGMDIRLLLPPRYAENWDIIRSYTSPKETTASETRYVELAAQKKTGEEIPVHVSISENPNPEKRVFTAILRDISERKAYEEELRLLSITDSLTRLFNRRHFYSLAQREMDRANRNKMPFAILLADIDQFKSYNDTYGHHGGDHLLKEVADLIRVTFRSMDAGFRFGGEEFLVLLPDTNTSGAMVAAERFRILLAGKEFHLPPAGDPVRATTSIGISEYREGDTVDDMVRHADMALYAAKNGGRNRSVTYEQLGGGAHFTPPSMA
jgi:diguanylate cyclase (GGDEF)-like protein/PAS domain S-box-containing protein